MSDLLKNALSRREFDRRSILRTTAGIGAIAFVGGPLLAACSSSGGSAAAPTTSAPAGSTSSGSSGTVKPGSLGEASLRASWILNVEFAGSYIADTKGYYIDQGFTGIKITPGGASATPQDADVATGKSQFGISSPDITGAAIVAGAPLKIIGAQYQKNPFCIMSIETMKPIVKPEDMYGKKIGVQATNESVWNAFVKASGIDASKIKKVPVEFDPTPLTKGDVDGWFSFVTNEPNTITGMGFKPVVMMLADYGYPLVSETYMTTQKLLDEKPELVKAFLIAEIKGWKDNVADPVLGATLAANHYGKGLGLTVEEQTLESKGENLLISTDETKKNGLFTITDALIEENIKTLAIGGINLTADQLFDLSILKSIYAEDPSLI